jgi:hypothetical protein
MSATHSYTNEARQIGESACARFQQWYMNGPSHEAGALAYDLVSAIRAMLAKMPDIPDGPNSEVTSAAHAVLCRQGEGCCNECAVLWDFINGRDATGGSANG